MATSSDSLTMKVSWADRVLRRPWIGALAFAAVLLWKPSAHAITVTMHHLFDGPMQYLIGAVIGLAGFWLVWRGFRRDELSATCLGFMGGALIWLGWFESSFQLFAQALKLEPVMWQGFPLLSPELQVIESSAILFLAVLIFTGANKDTRCRMFMWFHRNFRLRPNQPTPGYRRQFARITAMEMIFVNWFFYVVNIAVFDPRLLGPRHTVTYALWVVFLAWGCYLLWKLLKYTSIAGAIRYAIPTVGAFWISIEMAAQWQLFSEIWVRPFEFPAANILIIAAFVASGTLINLTGRRGSPAQP